MKSNFGLYALVALTVLGLISKIIESGNLNIFQSVVTVAQAAQ